MMTELKKQELFELAYNRLKWPMRKYFNKRNIHGDVLDDAYHFASMVLWRALDKYQEQGKYLSWAYIVLMRQMFEYIGQEAERSTRHAAHVSNMATSIEDSEYSFNTDTIDLMKFIDSAPSEILVPFVVNFSGVPWSQIFGGPGTTTSTRHGQEIESKIRRIADEIFSEQKGQVGRVHISSAQTGRRGLRHMLDESRACNDGRDKGSRNRSKHSAASRKRRSHSVPKWLSKAGDNSDWWGYRHRVSGKDNCNVT